MNREVITVETTIKAPIETVWECWTKPEHIVNWNFASEEWCCPSAVNDLSPGGKLNWRMEARDGSMGFDFTGVYKQIKPQKLINYEISDGRNVKIIFFVVDQAVKLSETFEVEGINSVEMQRAGWQAILENFRKYVESKI